MQTKSLLTITILLFISFNAFAVLKTGSTPIYAVTTEGQGLVATLHLEIEKGQGKIWTNVSPLVGTSTQNAEITAVNVAKKYFKDVDNYDYKFSIKSSASVVDGPSAGAAMALLVISMLTDKELPKNVSISGTITQNGQIGPVGGIYEKAKEASKTGIKLFMIPKGEAIQTKKDNGIGSVNLIEYAPKEWGMKVVEVKNIDEALKLAYSDIEKIDVNTNVDKAIPEFIPQKIQLQKETSDFKLLVTNYIKKAKEQVKEARLAISSSLIDDPELVFALQQTVNESESMIQKAEILNEQNYLYSAANFSFLAKSNAIMVKEIAINPGILEENSKNFDLKLAQLNKEITQYEKQLNEKVPKKNLEMFISAQQRFIYAKNSLEELMEGKKITIVISNNNQDYFSTNLAKLRKYANAVAWLEVSKDFLSIVQEDEVLTRQSTLKERVEEKIGYTKKEMESIEDEGVIEEAQRRIDSALKAVEMNWFEPALLDAATAKAFIDAEKDSFDKNIEDLNKTLIESIEETEKKVSNNKSVWAILYLAHAKYFLASANYYLELGSEPLAIENLKRGISIAYLASEIYDNVLEVNKVYEKIPAEKIQEKTEMEIKVENKGFSIMPIALGFGFAILIFIALLVIVSRSSPNRTNLSSELAAAKRKLSEIESNFISGKLSHENYEKLKREYQEKIQKLEKEIAEKTKHLIAYDNYSLTLSILNERLKNLKRLFKEGMLPRQEFENQSKQIIAEINSLEKKLYEETQTLEKEQTKEKKTKKTQRKNKEELKNDKNK
ncbi:MAG: S16 family serine protease [Candidatus Diapherotrites archaeon]